MASAPAQRRAARHFAVTGVGPRGKVDAVRKLSRSPSPERCFVLLSGHRGPKGGWEPWGYIARKRFLRVGAGLFFFFCRRIISIQTLLLFLLLRLPRASPAPSVVKCPYHWGLKRFNPSDQYTNSQQAFSLKCTHNYKQTDVVESGFCCFLASLPA